MAYDRDKGLEGFGEGLGGFEKTKEALSEASIFTIKFDLADLAAGGSSADFSALPFKSEFVGASAKAFVATGTTAALHVRTPAPDSPNRIDLMPALDIKTGAGTDVNAVPQVYDAELNHPETKAARTLERGQRFTVSSVQTDAGATEGVRATLFFKRLPTS